MSVESDKTFEDILGLWKASPEPSRYDRPYPQMDVNLEDMTIAINSYLIFGDVDGQRELSQSQMGCDTMGRFHRTLSKHFLKTCPASKSGVERCMNRNRTVKTWKKFYSDHVAETLNREDKTDLQQEIEEHARAVVAEDLRSCWKTLMTTPYESEDAYEQPISEPVVIEGFGFETISRPPSRKSEDGGSTWTGNRFSSALSSLFLPFTRSGDRSGTDSPHQSGYNSSSDSCQGSRSRSDLRFESLVQGRGSSKDLRSKPSMSGLGRLLRGMSGSHVK